MMNGGVTVRFLSLQHLEGTPAAIRYRPPTMMLSFCSLQLLLLFSCWFPLKKFTDEPG